LDKSYGPYLSLSARHPYLRVGILDFKTTLLGIVDHCLAWIARRSIKPPLLNSLDTTPLVRNRPQPVKIWHEARRQFKTMLEQWSMVEKMDEPEENLESIPGPIAEQNQMSTQRIFFITRYKTKQFKTTRKKRAGTKFRSYHPKVASTPESGLINFCLGHLRVAVSIISGVHASKRQEILVERLSMI
jgi:hypothetical protein